MTRRRSIGLYVFPPPVSLEDWLQYETAEAPNAQAALAQWFDQVPEWCRQVIRRHPRSSHAKLARLILDKASFVQRLVESVHRQDDKHFVVLQTMHFMRAVRDLEHNLALLATVESRRRSNAALPKARRSPRKPRYTRAQCKVAYAEAGGKLWRMAEILNCDPGTASKYCDLYQCRNL